MAAKASTHSSTNAQRDLPNEIPDHLSAYSKLPGRLPTDCTPGHALYAGQARRPDVLRSRAAPAARHCDLAVALDSAESGTVLARSADPRVPPAIRTKGLTAAAEIAAFLRATAHPRDSRHGPAGFGAQYRNPSRNPGGSDAALEKWIRETANSTDHPACTAAMGADPDSVLDERLRVRGVNGLRVAKAG